jgi:hypothetical protein
MASRQALPAVTARPSIPLVFIKFSAIQETLSAFSRNTTSRVGTGSSPARFKQRLVILFFLYIIWLSIFVNPFYRLVSDACAAVWLDTAQALWASPGRPANSVSVQQDAGRVFRSGRVYNVPIGGRTDPTGGR